MAKTSGTTKSVGAGGATAARQHTAQEYADYFKLQKAGAMTQLANNQITQAEYDKRVVELEKREAASKNQALADKVIDLVSISNSKYNDISKVYLTPTTKGNWVVNYDGKDTGLILNSGNLTAAQVRKLKLNKK